jgi:hypothetical protein
MKEESNFIPGIYNWCDRWCERCAQTVRCRSFYMEQQQKKADPDKDWHEEIEDDFSETLLMLEQVAEELGIDLDSTREDAESIDALQEAQAILIDRHPLIELAESYLKKGKEWIDLDLCTDKFEGWKFPTDTGAPDAEEVEAYLNLVGDAMEVVQWYLYFIPGKVKRSLHDQMDDFWDQFPDEERSDLGSAKITLIAIERSIEAWRVFQQFFPKDERLSEIVAVLGSLRNGMVEVFPNYPKFIRPGFDDEE